MCAQVEGDCFKGLRGLLKGLEEGCARKGEEGVADEGHGGRLAHDGGAKVDALMAADVDQAHPAPGVHPQVQHARHEDEGEEEAVVALRQAV